MIYKEKFYIFASKFYCRGVSSVGRALAWHARGHEFESRTLHERGKRKAAKQSDFAKERARKFIFDSPFLRKSNLLEENLSFFEFAHDTAGGKRKASVFLRANLGGRPLGFARDDRSRISPMTPPEARERRAFFCEPISAGGCSRRRREHALFHQSIRCGIGKNNPGGECPCLFEVHLGV